MTKIALHALLISLFVLAAGCAKNEEPATTATPDEPATKAIPDQSNIPPEKRLRVGPSEPAPGPEVSAVSFGRGLASNKGVTVTFMHNVTEYKNGTADGEFKQSASGAAGTIDIEAEVTCAKLDGKEGKGWVGGKVTRNGSTNPMYAGAAGADVWFSILDRGATELTAFISMPAFRQDKVATAAEFCEKKPWSDDNLLEVSEGALAIFP